MPLIRPQLITFGGNPVTDHNRSPLDIGIEALVDDRRMADGSLRRYHVARKRTFSLSWEMLPTEDSETADGYWGGNSIENFYNLNTGSFTMGVTKKDDTVTNYTVVFKDYSRDVVKRWDIHFWDISISLEEV